MPRSSFVCTACAHVAPRWLGQCPSCSEWNTIVEEARPASVAGRGGRAGRAGNGAPAAKPVPLRSVQAPAIPRLKTQIGELDRVLGGGLVPGSLVLIGGSPGIGKSTLTAMALGNLAGAGRRA